MIEVKRLLQRITAAGVHSAGRRRAIIVELSPDRPGLIGFRLKVTRTTYYLLVEACYRDALRGEIARLKAERRKEKAARRLTNRKT